MGCGAELAVPGPPRELPPDERRQATIVFADLSGYTAVAESMDPETVKALVGRCLHRLSEEVDRRGGQIDKFIGDNVMAIFGAPVTHEDDAERAVRAALAMQDAMGEINEGLLGSHEVSFALRVGVNSGEVAAGAMGEGYTVMGDTVNVAARLQQAAEPGAVIVGERTAQATRGAFRYRELEPLVLKGRSKPVRAWAAEATLAALPERRSVRHSLSPLVGREPELRLLESLAERVERDRSAHVVTVVGQAGVGKSRLLLEFEQLLAAMPRSPRIRRGRCLPYGTGIVYWALGEVLRGEFGIVDGDGAGVAWTKLRSGMVRLTGDGGERGAAIIARLLGIEVPGAAEPASEDPQRLRDSFFAAVRSCVEELALERPLVLTFEDIHWADEGMLDLVEHIAQWVRAPLLILCLTRDELFERRPSWGSGRRNATTIALEPLSREQTQTLATALLEGRAEAAGAVAERADGNPLFAEELAQRLIEEGTDAQRLPDTVQALLAARLDSLDPFERRVLQHAAVAGRSFWASSLATLAGNRGEDLARALGSLEEKNLISRVTRAPLDDEHEYLFKHVLIRDVAYATLPKRVRCRLHFEMGVFLEERAGDRVEETVAVLAEHYSSAARLGEEIALPADELEPLRAIGVRFLEAAGDAAAAIYSNGEAFDRYAGACRLAGADAETTARILEKQGDVALSLGRVDAALEVWERCIEYQRGQEDLRRLADLHRKVGAALWEKGETRQAIEGYQRGISLLKDGAPTAELVRLYEEAAWLYVDTGDNMLAIYAAEKALRLAERLDEVGAASRAHGIFGRVFGRIGDNPKARENLERSVDLARESSATETIRALLTLGYHLQSSEADYGAARGAYEQALAAAERVADLPAQVDLRSALGLLAAYRGDWDEVAADVDASLELAEREGLVGKMAYPYSLRGLLHWRTGDFAAAERHYRHSLELADQVGSSEVAFWARFGLAVCLRDAGETGRAVSTLDAAIDGCERAGLIPQSIQATSLRSLVLALDDRLDAARAAAADAWQLAERLPDPAGHAAALAARGATAADPEEAEPLLARSHDLWAELGRPIDAAFSDLLAARLLRSGPAARAAAEAYTRLGVEHLAAQANALAGHSGLG
jgi:class 3 adenylate cyclase/tetratricopeptide (TPR) repeat protein